MVLFIILLFIYYLSVNIKPPRHRFGFSLAWGWQNLALDSLDITTSSFTSQNTIINWNDMEYNEQQIILNLLYIVWFDLRKFSSNLSSVMMFTSFYFLIKIWLLFGIKINMI